MGRTSYDILSSSHRYILTVVGVWQDPFREYEILERVLQKLDPSSQVHNLNNQYLRVMGNSIAYNSD